MPLPLSPAASPSPRAQHTVAVILVKQTLPATAHVLPTQFTSADRHQRIHNSLPPCIGISRFTRTPTLPQRSAPGGQASSAALASRCSQSFTPLPSSPSLLQVFCNSS